MESYISHYFESLEARTRAHPGPKHAPSGADPITAEHVLAQKDLARVIREAVNEDERSELMEILDLIINEGWCLKNDSARFCEKLGLDPTTGSAGWQRFNRLRNKFREVVRRCMPPTAEPNPA